MTILRSLVPHLAACAWLALAAVPAHAIDVEAGDPPASVADGQLTVGRRTLRLPAGEWTMAARAERHMTMAGVDRIGTSVAAYAMQVQGTRMQAAVALRLSRTSVPTTGWRDEPCKVEGALFKDAFDNNYKFPECLLVYKRAGHLGPSSTELYLQARQWAEEHHVRRGPVYEIAYTRYGPGDFGSVRAFVPLQAFADDGDAIAWARQLPPALSRMFEGRDGYGALPPLPVPAARPGAAQ